MNRLIDSHAHLDDEAFDDDRQEIIASLYDDGVAFVINPASDLASSKRAVELAKKYKNIYAAVGVHPHEIEELTEEEIDELKLLCKEKKVKAIGEIGLDYFYDNSPRDLQKKGFERQIELAEELGLPIIIHSRDAIQDTYDILKKYEGRVFGVLHCYSSSVEMAKEFIKLGYYISLGGPVTFKKSQEPKRVAKLVDLDRLLVETDSPYLSPEPLRGKRNQPKNTLITARLIAQLRGISEEELFEKTRENTKRLFKIDED